LGKPEFRVVYLITMGLKHLLAKAARSKPLWAFREDANLSDLKPTYGLFSLLGVGIGGTLGSGLFVLSGKIAHEYSGNITFLSWLISGLVCACTAISYAELSCILLSPGSTYAFTYLAFGEFMAVAGAFLLSLEYGLSGAAVARAWGDKLAFWFSYNEWAGCTGSTEILTAGGSPPPCWVNSVGGTSFNPAAVFLSVLLLGCLLKGVEAGRIVANVLVTINVSVVLFVIILGAVYTDPNNLTPLMPEPTESTKGGFEGIVMGATTGFFAYIGFDEVTCITAEAIYPKRDIPLAIVISVLSITAIYCAASVVLVGMQPYYLINLSEGFGTAFLYVGAPWAAQFVIAAQIFCILPATTLASYIPQSRLFYAMSVDGMLPKIFRKAQSDGSLFWSTVIFGTVVTVIAAFMEFSYLNDLISGGILLSFIFSNSALISIRSKHQGTPYILVISALVLVAMLVFTKSEGVVGQGIGIGIWGVSIVLCGVMHYKCNFDGLGSGFTVPFVPWTPFLAISLNAFLISQLPWTGILEVLGLCVFAFFVYACYGYRHGKDFAQENVDIEGLPVEEKGMTKKVSRSAIGPDCGAEE